MRLFLALVLLFALAVGCRAQTAGVATATTNSTTNSTTVPMTPLTPATPRNVSFRVGVVSAAAGSLRTHLLPIALALYDIATRSANASLPAVATRLASNISIMTMVRQVAPLDLTSSSTGSAAATSQMMRNRQSAIMLGLDLVNGTDYAGLSSSSANFRTRLLTATTPTPPTADLLLGGPTEDVCDSLELVASGFDRIFLGTYCRDKEHSRRPNFFSIIPPDAYIAEVIVRISLGMRWQRIGLLYEHSAKGILFFSIIALFFLRSSSVAVVCACVGLCRLPFYRYP